MRRRYRYDKDLDCLVEILPQERGPNPGPFFMPDIRPFLANAHRPEPGQEGHPVRIESRSQLAAYERANGIRQAGDIKNGDIIRTVNKRWEQSRKAAGNTGFKWDD